MRDGRLKEPREHMFGDFSQVTPSVALVTKLNPTEFSSHDRRDCYYPVRTSSFVQGVLPAWDTVWSPVITHPAFMMREGPLTQEQHLSEMACPPMCGQ